jgi:hypothetical protein
VKKTSSTFNLRGASRERYGADKFDLSRCRVLNMHLDVAQFRRVNLMVQGRQTSPNLLGLTVCAGSTWDKGAKTSLIRPMFHGKQELRLYTCMCREGLLRAPGTTQLYACLDSHGSYGSRTSFFNCPSIEREVKYVQVGPRAKSGNTLIFLKIREHFSAIYNRKRNKNKVK